MLSKVSFIPFVNFLLSLYLSNRQEKKISTRRIGKGPVKPSLFIDDKIISLKTQENQLQQIVRESSDMVGYQINK